MGTIKKAVVKIKMKMGIDPFKVVERALAGVRKKLPDRIVAVDYDEGADVLYVKFRHAKIVDNAPLDDDGLVLASLDGKGHVVGLIIMEALKFAMA
jgi:uncharacterized protein YuzE